LLLESPRWWKISRLEGEPPLNEAPEEPGKELERALNIGKEEVLGEELEKGEEEGLDEELEEEVEEELEEEWEDAWEED
jgi:hypothetical protein